MVIKILNLVKKHPIAEYRELDKDGHGANPCVTGSETFETFNEPIECKILGTKIREIDLLKDHDQLGKIHYNYRKSRNQIIHSLRTKAKGCF